MASTPARPEYQQSTVEAEDEEKLYDDDGESFVNSCGLSTTSSVSSSIRHYQYDNGRRYHAFKEGAYNLPNDEEEQDRLNLHHHIHKLKLDGELYRAPIPTNVSRILDLGTGTGIWAIEIADQFPKATVIGNDLSPIQPNWVPPNLQFEIDDFEAEWVYTKPFDFIHARDLQGSVSDYDQLLQQAFRSLTPGGWFEFSDADIIICGDDDTLQDASNLLEANRLVLEASAQLGKVMGTARQHRRRLLDAGFTNIREETYKIPLSPWAKSPKLKELGKYHQVNMIESLDAYCFALLTRVLGWHIDQVRVLLAGARKELLDRRIHTYALWFHVYGQKPKD
ncbi:putative TAM domain methyltransferase [Aspergillus leporis]|uniref:Putative TAM domain methyltransferase n=1 Tax=Aspergillus leporis TaxID=41062 RepID=A0A5N5WJW9_9EURO|nr:putative TAM domain methyltransferase [Aspergillus leporis]